MEKKLIEKQTLSPKRVKSGLLLSENYKSANMRLAAF